MKEKRKYLRIQLSFPVEFNTIRRKNYISSVSKDLSLGGAKILSDKAISKDDKFQLTVNLIDKVLNLKVKVAWCNKEKTQDTYSAGLEFIGLKQPERKFLSQFLSKIYPA